MMVTRIKIDSSEIERLVREYPDISREVRTAKLTEALSLLEAEIQKKTPYGAGPIHLRDSIFDQVAVSGQRVSGVVGTPLEHGIPVELGTKPHFPPIAPIQFWVQKKLRIEDEKQSRAVAFLIARAISRRGTRGQKMFGTTFEENEHRVMTILGEITGEIVRRADAV